ncbi:MAG: polysaccharide biosynthesis protein [Oscillospiraceae bacterium]|nr:polysaccharide biosynthesis protein [Oscillospiraceae bacterium]
MRLNVKSVTYILIDIICIAVAMLFGGLLRFDMSIAEALSFFGGVSYIYYIVCVVAVIGSGILFGTYNTIYLSVSYRDVQRQFVISAIAIAAAYISHLIFDFPISMSITCMFGFFYFIFTLGVRCVEHFYKMAVLSSRSDRAEIKRVIVIGAGTAGSMLIHMLTTRRDMNLIPVAVLDDAPFKQKMTLSGVRVCGEIADVAEIAKDKRADEIIIAIPSANSAQFKEIYEKCKSADIPVKTFGSLVDFHEFMAGSKAALKSISIEDLLFRDSIKTDMSAVSSYMTGKTVLVTGGAGSIGSEICRQVLALGCKYLVIFDINENGLFFLQNELLEKYSADRFCVRVGSVRDKERLDYLFRRHRFDIVLHAAAHKHVPLMEDNVFEAVKNNIFGTKNTIEACIEHGTDRFVLISTDKAVNPTNIMGATKRAAELLVQRYNGRGCELSAVRFGNVLGSNGSVIPIFRRQIETGGPVTVTHRDIMRYFMTIPEAVSLVLNAGVSAAGGEIFVLDMGEPVSIYDLARNMIELAGLRPDVDIKIEFTGLRPGEKMFEELKLDSETYTRTAMDKIFVMHTDEVPKSIDADIERLAALLAEDCGEPAIREAVFDTIAVDFEESTKHGGNLAEFSSLS